MKSFFHLNTLNTQQVKCSFCTKIFCCSKCRLKHEENVHFEEIAECKAEERLQNLCYLCNSEKLPFGINFDFMASDMVQHIVEVHLPLKCDRCSRVFGNAEDLKNVLKCCPPMINDNVANNVTVDIESTEAKPLIDANPKSDNFSNHPENLDESCKDLTPLGQINMKWRRKSKEFGKSDGMIDDLAAKEDKQRQTSTPMQGNLLTTNHFTDSASYNASSIHISSINCTSSSSESDACSPPIAASKPEFAHPISPQRHQKFNKSRAKLPVQATPLRQVMTKSIQRAISQHGHYRQSPFALQQRKMSFNSSNSSNETTSRSLMKFPCEVEAPLDLRLSPAIRRFRKVTTTKVEEISHSAVDNDGEPDLINFQTHIEFEQIEVIIKRGEIKNDTSTMTSYKSCISDSSCTGRSMPDNHFTPKIVGNNMLKKTISFETPKTIEKTPSFLLKATEEENEEEDDDDVFHTPRSTPVRTLRHRPTTDFVNPIENDENQETKSSNSRNNLWNFVSTVMKIAAKKSEDIGETLSSDKMWSFNFKQPEFVKKATDYFVKRSESDDHSHKRRRTSSNSEPKSGSQSSPALKRQKIQARRPIGRMRNLS